MANNTKKIAVIVSGWHFPSQFYEAIARQILPDGWSMKLFCVSHRNPSFAKEEKKDKKFLGDRAYLDEKLYKSIITEEEIKKLGWEYVETPNTVGDWGNTNQWLELHDYKEYDLFFISHDDNLILSDFFFKSVIEDSSYDKWGIMANSLGMPEGWIRGSCEFFKKSVIKKLGGKFDLSMVSLNRQGVTTATENLNELYDWNNTVEPLMKFINNPKNGIGLAFLSPSYRVSAFCIEGERGYISNTHGANTEKENMGLKFLKQNGII